MTYCLGIAVTDGLVLASDSRTNAGIDYVTSFSKLHVLNPAPDRLFVLLSAGNLASTQEVINLIHRDLDQPLTGTGATLITARYLFEAVDYVGRVSLAVQRDRGPTLAASGVSAQTTLILGGQIGGQPPGLYLIYAEGNYISASPETPYLQIGENKYGKPALDRIVRPDMSLEEAARLCLVSLDATSRSNLTVGPPFELVIYPRDSLAIRQRLKLAQDDPLLTSISRSWNTGLRGAFAALPHFDWEPRAEAQPAG
ncbi:MAG: 20S proteasome subunit A/B [Chromatiaceae bacterium]|nr:MAG: 20S proteasome subunit A/B [Chromatiaceae bacterium]